MKIDYATYLDKIHGGWIGKSIGGTIGARFEGNKNWIEIDPSEAFPEKIPPNDDLDIQVVWLSVLEQLGARLAADDLADAWLEGCWYPFNEYGNFRRNYQLGIHPPHSGTYNNEFFETGMGCPIRSEIWGYVFPGAPDLAARFAELDGSLDHGKESISAEKMLSGMASMAFFISDVHRLIRMNLHYLGPGTAVHTLVTKAIESYDQGLSLRQARERLIVLRGHPEACDAPLNVAFTILGMLHGKGDMGQTILSALKCGYDTDCTLATSGALIGQILGANGIPAQWKDPIGDELVMGIEYRRPEMTLSALARDTARVGVLISRDGNPAVEITDAPVLEPLPKVKRHGPIRVDYANGPETTPWNPVAVAVRAFDLDPEYGPFRFSIECPSGWEVLPREDVRNPRNPNQWTTARFTLVPDPENPVWQMRNTFLARVKSSKWRWCEQVFPFGVVGAALWKCLGVYFDPREVGVNSDGSARTLDRSKMTYPHRLFQHHFVSLDRRYINEKDPDVDDLYRHWSGIFGRSAVVWSHGFRIRPEDLIGLRGEYCVYLWHELVSSDDRNVYFVVGNNDAYRIYVNGEKIAERDEYTWYSPYNDAYPVKLNKGANPILLKLLRRGEHLDFSLGVRHYEEGKGHNCLDWCVDLAYGGVTPSYSSG